jgi:HJR/Mrr/RecB family endonuclease
MEMIMKVDPYNLTPAQFEEEVRKAVVGATDPADAEQRVKAHFSPQPLVWVQERGEHHFGARVMQKPGAENVDILWKR